MNWSVIIEKVMGVLAKVGLPLLLMFQASSNAKKKEQLKQAKEEMKSNEKHSKNRKLIANMSDDELLKYLNRK